MPVERAIGVIVESIKQAARRVPLGSMRILIENTAGMGSCVGSQLEEVGAIVRGLRALNAGACLDTAHLLASGYDIRSEAGLEQTIEAIDRSIGLENVPIFHVNDSKVPLGGGRAFLLETPIDDPGDDRKNVAKLWELAGVEGPSAAKGYSMLTPAIKKMMARKGKRLSARHLPAVKKKGKVAKR